MATVANLIVNVSAKTSGLNSELGSANSSIKKFAANAAKSLAVIGAAVVGGVAVSLIGIKNSINETEAQISRLVDTASKFKSSVADLQALQYAAGQAGLGAEGLNSALGFMLKNLGAAGRGATETAKAFEELDLDISRLARQSVSEQFLAISSALKKVTDTSKQFALGQKIFGRGVTEALTLINEDVGSLIDEYGKLGVALTDTQAKGVEAFGDIKGTFDQFALGFKQQVTANIAPALTGIIQYIIDLVKEAGGIQEVAKQASIGLLNFGITGINAVSGMIVWFKELGLLIDNIKVVIETVAVTFARFVEATKAISLDKFKQGFGLGEAAFNFANPDAGQQGAVTDTLTPSINKLTENTAKLNSFQESANQRVSDLKSIVEKQVQAVQQMTTNTEKVRSGNSPSNSVFTQGAGSFSDRPDTTSNVNVKVEITDNLLRVIDTRVETQMNNASRGVN